MSGFEDTLVAKSDQINGPDLVAGGMIITLRDMERLKVTPGEAQPVSMRFEGSEKFYRPCLGMRRLLSRCWGKIGDGKHWNGRRISLYYDPDVTYGKDTPGGIRIDAVSDIEAPMKVTVPVRRGVVKTYTVRPLPPASRAAPDRAPAPAPVADAMDDPAYDEPAPDPDAAFAAASRAASQGKASFTVWWNTVEGKSMRALVKPRMTELTTMAAAYDAQVAAEIADDEGPVM